MSAKCATFVDNLSMPFDPEALTWTGLLTQWVQFAQATLALPDKAEGPRWRASTPAIINLQAVTFALADLDRLPADEQALALDRAELLIHSASRQLDEIWENNPTAALREIAHDARTALDLCVRKSTAATDSPASGEPPPAA